MLWKISRIKTQNVFKIKNISHLFRNFFYMIWGEILKSWENWQFTHVSDYYYVKIKELSTLLLLLSEKIHMHLMTYIYLYLTHTYTHTLACIHKFTVKPILVSVMKTQGYKKFCCSPSTLTISNKFHLFIRGHRK